MPPARRALAAALPVLLGLLPAPSRAAPADGRGDAKVRCAAAYEQAQVLRRQDKLSASRSELLICEATCPRTLVVDCTRWRSEVDALMPTVLFVATDAQGHPLGARVLMDGSSLLDALPGRAVPVDTGDHTFRFESASGWTEDVRVSLHGGERDREVKAVLSPPPQPSEASPPRRPVPSATYGLAAAGFGGLGIAGLVSLIGHFQVGHLDALCAPHCSAAEVTTVRTLYDVAWTSAGIGAASLVAALLVWSPWEAPSPAATSTARARFFLAPAPGGAVVGLDLR